MSKIALRLKSVIVISRSHLCCVQHPGVAPLAYVYLHIDRPHQLSTLLVVLPFSRFSIAVNMSGGMCIPPPRVVF